MVDQDQLTAQALSAIRDEALGCTRCPLFATRTQVVFGAGPPRAKLMVVGEAPGKDEDRAGRPFDGRAGRTLDRLLEKAGLARTNVYVANVVMSRPPNDRNPRADEIAACGPYLEIQRQLVGPRVIIALGAFAAGRLLGRQVAITEARGRVYRLGAALVVPTFHPSAIPRRPERRAQVEQDFRRAAELLELPEAQ